MPKLVTLVVYLVVSTTFAESASKERLAEFLRFPAPIREMIVECDWYAHANGRTNINWVITRAALNTGGRAKSNFLCAPFGL